MNRRLPLLLLLPLLAACSRGVAVESDARAGAEPAREIVAMLSESAESWNRGDLDGFLDDYLDSPETTFVGSSGVTRGRAEVRRRYLESYWKSGTPKDALRFEEIEVRPLGPDHALAIGRFVLHDRGSAETTATGMFSLVLRRTADGWRIVHDHSS